VAQRHWFDSNLKHGELMKAKAKQPLIMIADHDEMERGLLKAILKLKGFRVIEETLDLAKEHRPDLLVVDLNLTRVSGVEAEQKFCRACGAGLQMITQPLDDLATVPDLNRTPATSSKDEKQRVSRLMPWGLIIMFTGIAAGITGKMLVHEEMVTVVGALISVAGMFLTVYPYLSPPSRQKVYSSPSSQPDILSQSKPDKSLPRESNIEYLPSITERTTNLLKTSATNKAETERRR
jgi:DNA-binding NarL/FixJ family response regulator